MKLRLAIACSGLGHVRRGNETGSRMLAEAFQDMGVDVTLFGGAPLDGVGCRYEVVPTLRRESALVRGWLSWGRRYILEQYAFEHFLSRRIRPGEFDVVQVGDPVLALRLHRRAERHGYRVLYQNGQLLGPTWCGKFDFVQIPAPYYRTVAEAEGVDTRGWRVIPYPVDADRFLPACSTRPERRELLGGTVPDDAIVALAVGDFAPTSPRRSRRS
jgi:1,2-diacylglycerol 3-alpha-glucosyltransferase